MRFASNVAQAVGNTPLIELRRASEETGCTNSRQGRVREPYDHVDHGQGFRHRLGINDIAVHLESAGAGPVANTIIEQQNGPCLTFFAKCSACAKWPLKNLEAGSRKLF